MIVGEVRVCDILADRIIVQNPQFPAGPRVRRALESPPQQIGNPAGARSAGVPALTHLLGRGLRPISSSPGAQRLALSDAADGHQARGLFVPRTAPCHVPSDRSSGCSRPPAGRSQPLKSPAAGAGPARSAPSTAPLPALYRPPRLPPAWRDPQASAAFARRRCASASALDRGDVASMLRRIAPQNRCLRADLTPCQLPYMVIQYR